MAKTKKPMTKLELLNLASKGYPDDYLKEYIGEVGEMKGFHAGDTLAYSIVSNLGETFLPTSSKREQLDEAVRVLNTMISDIQGVIDALKGA